MTSINVYDKGQTDALLAAKADAADLPSAAELVPSYAGASADDVLTIENGAPVWKAASGGGSEVLRATFTGISAVKDFAAWVLANATPDDVISLKWNWTYAGTSLNLTGPALSLSEQTTGTNPILDGISIRTSDLASDSKFVYGRLKTVTVDDNKTFDGYYLQVLSSSSAISATSSRQNNSETSVVKATITKHTYTRRRSWSEYLRASVASEEQTEGLRLRAVAQRLLASRTNHLLHFQ